MKNLIKSESIKAVGLDNLIGPLDVLTVQGQLVEGAQVQAVIVSAGSKKNIAKIDKGKFTSSFAYKDGVPPSIEVEAIDKDGDWEKIIRSVTKKK